MQVRRVLFTLFFTRPPLVLCSVLTLTTDATQLLPNPLFLRFR